jgi:hypothetical protein
MLSVTFGNWLLLDGVLSCTKTPEAKQCSEIDLSGVDSERNAYGYDDSELNGSYGRNWVVAW